MQKIKPDSIPGRLKILRKRLRLTQTQMAERLRVSLSLYSKVEVNRSKVSPALVENICRRFGISEDWLRYGLGNLPADIELQAEIPILLTKLAETQILRILELSQESASRILAEQIADTLQIPFAQALAILVKEKWQSSTP